MTQCDKQTRRDVARFERALRAYGIAACLRAAQLNDEGEGPAGIMHGHDCGFPFRTVGQVDAAINAGRWARSVGFTGREPQQLMDIAKRCRGIVQRAERELGPMPKASYLDLCADNLPDVSLSDLKAALVCAGVGYQA